MYMKLYGNAPYVGMDVLTIYELVLQVFTCGCVYISLLFVILELATKQCFIEEWRANGSAVA